MPNPQLGRGCFTTKFLPLLAAAILPLSAEVQEKTIAYQDGDTELEGFFAHDPNAPATGKAVLIVHQWTGLTENEKMRARMLAKLGYKTFALDIYGKGIRPQPPESGKEAGKYKGNRKLYRQRLNAGLTQLKKITSLEEKNIAAIGYCFGGTGVLEIARDGTALAGVVSFHGGLGAAPEMAAKKGNLNTNILVLHGADDPFVPPTEIAGFMEEIAKTGAPLTFTSYPGAVHAFTQTGAGNDNARGAAYNAQADQKSWQTMQSFFTQIFSK